MTKTDTYKPRLYRETMGNSRWVSYRVAYMETDLWIAVTAGNFTSDTEKYSLDRILFYRGVLESHIREFPEFLTSLNPIFNTPESHPLIHEMYEASASAGTGPMSAVAGAVAEHVCKDLINQFGFQEVVVENGGDIYMKLAFPAAISIYAGESPLSDKLGLLIKPEQTPLSVCCSSGTVGHSLSFGIADACVIACGSGALADAFATACCNEVKSIDMVDEVTQMMLHKPEVISVVIIKDDKVGIGGRIEITVL